MSTAAPTVPPTLCLTRAQVATLLNCDPKTADRILRDHGVPVLKCGRVTRVRYADVAALFRPAPAPTTPPSAA